MEKRVIWKVPVEFGPQEIHLPVTNRFLRIGLGGSSPGLHAWFEVDPDKAKAVHYFDVIPTGVEFDATGAKFLQTFFCDAFVFHFYERNFLPNAMDSLRGDARSGLETGSGGLEG